MIRRQLISRLAQSSRMTLGALALCLAAMFATGAAAQAVDRRDEELVRFRSQVTALLAEQQSLRGEIAQRDLEVSRIRALNAKLEEASRVLARQRDDLVKGHASDLDSILANIANLRAHLAGEPGVTLETSVGYSSSADRLTRINSELRQMMLLKSQVGPLVRARDDGELDRCRRQQDVLQADATSLRQDISALRNTRSELTETHRQQLDIAVDALVDAKAYLRRPDSELRFDTAPTASYRSDRTPYERLLAEAGEFKWLRASCQARSQPTGLPRELAQLRDRMATGMTTDSYDVEAMPGREMIGGRIGRYYVIDVKNAASGVRFQFDGGRYTLNTGSADFRRSLNRFIADVMGKLDGNVRYDIYIRGSADSKSFEGRFEPGHEYRQIRYMRNAGGDKYRGDFDVHRIDGNVIRNTDLPDLRAAFIRNIVAETYPVKTPTILEGVITPKEDIKDRNVEVILFVEW